MKSFGINDGLAIVFRQMTVNYCTSLIGWLPVPVCIRIQVDWMTVNNCKPVFLSDDRHYLSVYNWPSKSLNDRKYLYCSVMTDWMIVNTCTELPVEQLTVNFCIDLPID